MGRVLIIALCIAYILNPFDLLPDVVPVVGWADDLAAALIGLRTFMSQQQLPSKRI